MGLDRLHARRLASRATSSERLQPGSTLDVRRHSRDRDRASPRRGAPPEAGRLDAAVRGGPWARERLSRLRRLSRQQRLHRILASHQVLGNARATERSGDDDTYQPRQTLNRGSSAAGSPTPSRKTSRGCQRTSARAWTSSRDSARPQSSNAEALRHVRRLGPKLEEFSATGVLQSDGTLVGAPGKRQPRVWRILCGMSKADAAASTGIGFGSALAITISWLRRSFGPSSTGCVVGSMFCISGGRDGERAISRPGTTTDVSFARYQPSRGLPAVAQTFEPPGLPLNSPFSISEKRQPGCPSSGACRAHAIWWRHARSFFFIFSATRRQAPSSGHDIPCRVTVLRSCMSADRSRINPTLSSSPEGCGKCAGWP